MCRADLLPGRDEDDTCLVFCGIYIVQVSACRLCSTRDPSASFDDKKNTKNSDKIETTSDNYNIDNKIFIFPNPFKNEVQKY